MESDSTIHAPEDTQEPSREAARETGPRVTVVMSIYRPGQHLRDALQSVLDQTYPNLEVLVIDDGNPPGAMAHVEEIADDRLTLIRQPHAGKATALNRALARATGEYYAIQDADDLSDPRRIERQLAFMIEHPELAGSFCGFDLIVGGARLAPLAPAKSIATCQKNLAAFRMPGHDPTAMYRMSMVRDIRYEETLAIGQGFDYVLRVGELFPMMTIGECLYSYRVDGNSHSRRDPIRRDEFVRAILSRACERRGIAPADRPAPLRRPPVTPDAPRDPDNNLAAHFIESALYQRRNGDFWAGMRTALACARMRPLDTHYLKALAYMLTPESLLTLLRRRAKE